MRTWLAAVERALGRVELVLALVALLAMLGLSLADIVGRNFLQASVPYGDVVLRQLVLWVALPGAALAVAARRHLALDPANLADAPGWQRFTAIPFNFFAAAVCAVLAQAAWRYWLDESASVEPHWLAWFSVLLPVAFAVLALHFVLRAALASAAKPA